MFYLKRNLPTWERALRAAGAIALLAAALLPGIPAGGVLLWLLIASAATLALTGIVGFCPACAMFGRKPQAPAP